MTCGPSMSEESLCGRRRGVRRQRLPASAVPLLLRPVPPAGRGLGADLPPRGPDGPGPHRHDRHRHGPGGAPRPRLHPRPAGRLRRAARDLPAGGPAAAPTDPRPTSTPASAENVPLSGAVDVARPGDRIWVLDVTRRPTTPRTLRNPLDVLIASLSASVRNREEPTFPRGRPGRPLQAGRGLRLRRRLRLLAHPGADPARRGGGHGGPRVRRDDARPRRLTEIGYVAADLHGPRSPRVPLWRDTISRRSAPWKRQPSPPPATGLPRLPRPGRGPGGAQAVALAPGASLAKAVEDEIRRAAAG